MHDIPFDVLEAIVLLCDPKDLLVLSQVDRSLQDLAERRLYAYIGPMDITRTCRALYSVIHSALPRGSFVLDFGIHDSYFHHTNPGYHLFEGFYRLLGQALRQMSNLRSLYLHLHPSKAWVIRHCTAQLSTIVTNIPAGQFLASWLEDQEKLITLLLADNSPHPTPQDFTVSPNAANQLRFIGARGGVLKRLVPGRPVICAYLDYADDYMRDVEDDGERVDYLGVLDALYLSTGPLHTFSVHFRPVTVGTALSLTPFLTTTTFNLSHVRTLDLYWPRGEDYIIHIIPHIAPLLPNFSHLQAIQISASAQVNEDLFDSPDVVANSWREHNSSLKRVTFRDTSRWTKENPTTGLLPFCLEGSQMVSEQTPDGTEEVELLRSNMSAFPIKYFDEDIPFCFEQYAGTWRGALAVLA